MKNFLNFLNRKKNNNTAFSSARSLRMEQLEDRQLLSATTWTSEVAYGQVNGEEGNVLTLTGTYNDTLKEGLNVALFFNQSHIATTQYDGTNDDINVNIRVAEALDDEDNRIFDFPPENFPSSSTRPDVIDEAENTPLILNDGSADTNSYIKFNWDSSNSKIDPNGDANKYKFTEDLDSDTDGTQFIIVKMLLKNDLSNGVFNVLEFDA